MWKAAIRNIDRSIETRSVMSCALRSAHWREVEPHAWKKSLSDTSPSCFFFKNPRLGSIGSSAPGDNLVCEQKHPRWSINSGPSTGLTGVHERWSINRSEKTSWGWSINGAPQRQRPANPQLVVDLLVNSSDLNYKGLSFNGLQPSKSSRSAQELCPGHHPA